MEAAYWLVFGFSIWSLILLLGIGLNRLILIYGYHQKVSSFKASCEDGPTFAHRLGRAHANCYENLPILLGVVFFAYVTNHIAIINCGAYAFLGLRIAQSIVHMISTRSRAVLIRFLLFCFQLAIMIYWIIQLLWLTTY
jgi:hypothetical protein